MAKILLRRNHITGELYKDDPAIMAWDLVNEPYNPGDSSGTVLQATFPLNLQCTLAYVTMTRTYSKSTKCPALINIQLS